MSTINSLTSTESGADSLTDINNNFANLNTDKVEGTGAGTDQLLTVFNSSNKAIKGATGSGFVKTTSGVVSNVSTIVETDLALTDVGTADATSSRHGFLPKTPADSTKFLNGGTGPAFAAVKDSDLSLSDITTNDASTGRHGFLPKLAGDSTKFFRSDGTFAAAGVTFKFGSFSKDMTTTTTDTIAHGLGITPKIVSIRCIFAKNAVIAESTGTSNGSTESCIYKYYNTNGNVSDVSSDTRAVHFSYNNGTSDADYNRGVITLDATNITITWTKTGTISGGGGSASTAYLLWEAYA